MFQKAEITDINPHLVAFYKALQSGEITPQKVDEYLRREGDLLRNADDKGYAHYRAIRDQFNTSFASLDFLFLNRAGFNGMIRFLKKGNWNIPFCQKPDRFRDAYRTKIVNQVKNIQAVIKSGWQFSVNRFDKTLEKASQGDLIYCDPPYFGRYTDYFNQWAEEDEAELAWLLQKTKAKFILSTWHHNDFRENTSITKHWANFHVVTKNHFYHAGGKEENRNPVVEALVMNFEPPKVEGLAKAIEPSQQDLFAA